MYHWHQRLDLGLSVEWIFQDHFAFPQAGLLTVRIAFLPENVYFGVYLQIHDEAKNIYKKMVAETVLATTTKFSQQTCFTPCKAEQPLWDMEL